MKIMTIWGLMMMMTMEKMGIGWMLVRMMMIPMMKVEVGGLWIWRRCMRHLLVLPKLIKGGQQLVEEYKQLPHRPYPR